VGRVGDWSSRAARMVLDTKEPEALGGGHFASKAQTASSSSAGEDGLGGTWD
jgi:hypothetical protein